MENIENKIPSGREEYTPVNHSSVILSAEEIKSVFQPVLGYDNVLDVLFEDVKIGNNKKNAEVKRDYKIEIKEKRYQELKDRLNDADGFSESSWQKWIYANNEIFGTKYEKPLEKEKINISGSMPDYLFPTLDGFVDVLEIKLPKDKVIKLDKSHKGSWYFSSGANKAIGQVANYLKEIEERRPELNEHLKGKYNKDINFLKPRGYILIGNNSEWCGKKKMD